MDRGASSGVFTTSYPNSLIINEDSGSSFSGARDIPLPSSDSSFCSANTSFEVEWDFDSPVVSRSVSPYPSIVIPQNLFAGIDINVKNARARPLDIESSSEDYIPKKQPKMDELEVIKGPEEPVLFNVDIPIAD